MKVTYIDHSGFLVEVADTYLLFDYFRGDPGVLDKTRPIVVFVSHQHQDHYNHAIWKLKEKFEHITYILSKDIALSANFKMRMGITQEDEVNIYSVCPNETTSVALDNGEVLKVKTYRSTDAGVAFAVDYADKKIYHAGDLNLWVWPGEAEEENAAMSEMFYKELDEVKKESFDMAFVPLDPRQDTEAYGGMDAFLEQVDAKAVFPMHFWGKYDVIDSYINDRADRDYSRRLYRITKNSEVFSL